MSETMHKPETLASVQAVREHQRAWIENTRVAASEGKPFALCGSDEVEELFSLLDIPVLVYNYWNFVILSQRKGPHFSKVLEDRGYPGPHFFALGYGSTLDPEEAPWGGLPKPTIMVGSTRYESEMLISEKWARTFGCDYIPLDYNFSSHDKKPLPDDWWARLRTDWDQIVDTDRLELRMAEVKSLLAYLETKTGRTITQGALADMMELVNRQMDLWMEANYLIADAPDCPVSFKDQTAIYQAMWHRGTQKGVSFIEAYRDEVAQRVKDGTSAYAKGTKRMIYWSMDREPASHKYMQQQGASIVASSYTRCPSFYARETYGDPMRALCARHLFLFEVISPSWLLADVERWRGDAVILVEREDGPKGVLRTACEQAGIPVLCLPHTGDDEKTRDAIDRFMAANG